MKKPKKVSNKKKTQNLDKIDISNEIIIGLTPKKEEKNTKKKQQVKNKKKKKILPKKELYNNTPIKKEKKAKKRKKIIKYVVIFIFVLATIIGTMASPLFNIKTITVTGNEKITENEIISLSGIVLDNNIFKISKKAITEKILENPYIKSVEIKIKLPSEIEITVEERKTSFMLEYGSTYVYVNNQGYILEISSEKLDVPIIQGAETSTDEFIAGNRLCTNDLKKFDTIIKIMDIANNNDIGSLITRIDIENSENYILQFESEDKVAYIGDGTDLNTKILNIKVILEKESGIAGEIFVNMDLKTSNPIFRQKV